MAEANNTQRAGNFIDLTGHRFGRLTVIEWAGKSPHGHTLWRCACDCGGEKTCVVRSLRRGATKSCGCLSKETSTSIGRKRKTHGHAVARTPTYRAWSGMIERCTNPAGPAWKNYGGRGITICPRWRDSFEAFLEDMGERPAPHLSIDRIDNDGNYEAGNCRWATALQQTRNRRPKGN